MADCLKKQGYDPKTGKDRIGQEIDLRESGKKLNWQSSSKIDGPVSSKAPNFNRAKIPNPKSIVSGEETSDGDTKKKGKTDLKEGIDATRSKEPAKEPRSNKTERYPWAK